MSVVISGIGLVTPLSHHREGTWNAILNGKTGIKKTPNGLEAPIVRFELNGARSRMGDFALRATEEALVHAGFSLNECLNQPFGCVIGQSKPVVNSKLNPSLLLSSFTGWSAECVVKRTYQLTGPSFNLAAACASGVAAIQMGLRIIESRECHVAVVGASESSLNPLYRSGFQNLGVLADGDSPACVCPFDENRSGFAMGEGAGILILEDENHCRERRHSPLARIQNVVLQSARHDAIRFDENVDSVYALIKRTLSGKCPSYINAHGTGTEKNDQVESEGIRQALGELVDEVWVSSTKGATGHLLGAAGAVEAAISVLALRDQMIPGNVHLKKKDKRCQLNIAEKSLKKEISSTLSLSYGFGGQMAGVLFEQI